MKYATLPRPGGVPGGASWLMNWGLMASASAVSSSAGKISSRTRRAAKVMSEVAVVVIGPPSVTGATTWRRALILTPVAFSPMSENARPRRRYDAPRRRERAAGTRRRIIDAATRLFLERGYVGTTIPAVAVEAGVAVETVYRSAGGKAELLAAAVQAALAGGAERAELPVEKRPGVRRGIEGPHPPPQLRPHAATHPRGRGRRGRRPSPPPGARGG